MKRYFIMKSESEEKHSTFKPLPPLEVGSQVYGEWAEEIKEYSSLVEAKKALKKYNADYSISKGYPKGYILTSTDYYIMSVEVDEDGNFDYENTEIHDVAPYSADTLAEIQQMHDEKE